MSSTKADTDFDALRVTIGTRFREQLRTAVESALTAADDVLFDWAYGQSLKTKNTQDCIDLMRMLRVRRQSFIEHFLAHFDKNDTVDDADAGNEDKELALIPDEQLELECAVENFVTTVTNRSDALRSDLLRRLIVLDGDPDGETTVAGGLSERLSASHVAQTFRDAAARLEMDAGMQIVLFKLFERCATPALSEGYAQIDRDLTKAGVVAPRKAGKKETPAHQSAPELPPTAQGQSHDWASASMSQAASVPPPPAGGYFCNDTSGLSSQLAQQLAGFAPSAGGAGGYPTARGIPEGGFIAAQVQAAQVFAQQHVHRVDSLLGGYAAMAQSPDAARQTLQPLIQPLIRLAAAQPELLHDPQHRVRGLLDQAVAEGAADNSDSRALLRELQAALKAFAESVQLPEDWREHQDSYPDAERIEQSLQESRKLRSDRMLERARDYARQAVESVLAEHALVRSGDAWMRTVMVPYLAWVWISKGERSSAMQQATTLMDDCLALLDPERAPEARDDFEARALTISETLHGAGAKPAAVNRIMVRLRQLFAKACALSITLDALMGDQRFQDRTAPADDDNDTDAHQEQAATRNAEITPPTPAMSSDEWLSSQLRKGDWWRIQTDDEARTSFAQLDGFGDIGEPLYFSGIKADHTQRCEWTTLAASVLDGRSRPLHPSPAFSHFLRKRAAA